MQISWELNVSYKLVQVSIVYRLKKRYRFIAGDNTTLRSHDVDILIFLGIRQ